MDRRKKSRVDVELTCYVRAGKIKGQPLRTLTENVSRTGMLMRWMPDVPLPAVEKKLILDIALPENSEFGPRLMRCHTEVIRVVTGSRNSHEVALRVHSMRFVKTRREIRPADLLKMPVQAPRIV
jgi:c-di-GMP-binding flagellar brake protein YcgR